MQRGLQRQSSKDWKSLQVICLVVEATLMTQLDFVPYLFYI